MRLDDTCRRLPRPQGLSTASRRTHLLWVGGSATRFVRSRYSSCCLASYSRSVVWKLCTPALVAGRPGQTTHSPSSTLDPDCEVGSTRAPASSVVACLFRFPSSDTPSSFGVKFTSAHFFRHLFPTLEFVAPCFIVACSHFLDPA